MSNFNSPAKKSKAPLIIGVILGGVLLSLVCCGGIAYFGWDFIIGMAKAPIDNAVTALSADTEVANKLGTPITADQNQLGFTNYENNNGNGGASIDLNVSGPNGKAHVFGRMKLTAGIWSPEDITVEFPDGTSTKFPK